MLLPTSLVFLLVSGIAACLAANEDDETNPHASDAATNHFSGGSGLDGIYDEIYNRKHLREKRAFSSFQIVWRAILKTTFGFGRVVGPKSETRKYKKVGTMKEAIQDFYSLGPRGVKMEQGTLVGFVGDRRRTIILDTNSVDTPVLFLIPDAGSKNLVVRSIVYTAKVHLH